MNHQCQFCGEWVSDFFHCCEGKHKNDWIEAQYETMGWSTEVFCQCWKVDICVEPLI